jgi:hypothetical protein
MVPSDPPPASAPAPATDPPAAPPAPASADTINQALAAVKAAFPPDSTILSDLQLTASDDNTATITILINDGASGYGSDGIAPVMQAIWDQFDALDLPQNTDISYSLASDPSSVTNVKDLSHNFAILFGPLVPDDS